jgi:hypothetical protein
MIGKSIYHYLIAVECLRDTVDSEYYW